MVSMQELYTVNNHDIIDGETHTHTHIGLSRHITPSAVQLSYGILLKRSENLINAFIKEICQSFKGNKK